jgi:hypothetical protein
MKNHVDGAARLQLQHSRAVYVGDIDERRQELLRETKALRLAISGDTNSSDRVARLIRLEQSILKQISESGPDTWAQQKEIDGTVKVLHGVIQEFPESLSLMVRLANQHGLRDMATAFEALADRNE